MDNKPVAIRTHLVSFLFKEFEGKEASYMNTKSKSIKIYPFSSLGKILYSQLNPEMKLGKKDQFILYLMIERKKALEFQGHIYVEISKGYEKLLLPEENIKNINNLLEDIFRLAFCYFIEGALEYANIGVATAIDKFIDKYDLLESGFCNETLRRLYYREKDKDHKLQRFQNQSSNRVIGFSMSHD